MNNLVNALNARVQGEPLLASTIFIQSVPRRLLRDCYFIIIKGNKKKPPSSAKRGKRSPREQGEAKKEKEKKETAKKNRRVVTTWIAADDGGGKIDSCERVELIAVALSAALFPRLNFALSRTDGRSRVFPPSYKFLEPDYPNARASKRHARRNVRAYRL